MEPEVQRARQIEKQRAEDREWRLGLARYEENEARREAFVKVFGERLQRAFGDVSPDFVARMENSSEADRQRWIERFSSARSVGDVFGA
ncbi:MAG: hypothetical protein QM756_36860 [Polyangiaceae bacterium]